MAINTIDTNGLWAVGSTPIYVPAMETRISTSNIAGPSSGRDESGLMHIAWVRRKAWKIYLVYKGLTAAELANVQNWIVGKEFLFKFPYAGTTHTISAYCAESDVKLYSYASGSELYTDFSANVIDMCDKNYPG